MRLSIVFAVLCGVLAACGAELPRRVMHNRTLHPHDWTKLSRAHPDAAVRFHLAVTQRNQARLDAEVHAVSDPDSPRYGKHLTREQAAAIVAPEPAVVEEVLAWVKSYGVLAVATSDDVMAVAPVSVVERMFNTEMYSFEHHETKARVIAHYGESSVPHRVGEVIDFVTGLSLFPPQNLGPKKHTTGVNLEADGGPDYAVVPATLNSLYKIPKGVVHSNGGNTAGVIEFSPQGAGVMPSDMTEFAKQCGGLDTPISKKVGPWNPEAQVDVEATLDLQYIASTAAGCADLTFWTGTSWLYEFAQDFMKATSVPSVISISYGWAESAQCQIAGEECNQLGVDSQKYVERVNTEFAKIAAQGISVIVASGDAGAASKLNLNCDSTPNSPINPDYPAASPYITAVGATMLEGESQLTNAPSACAQQGGCSDGTGQEVVCSVPRALITSGGGFSNYAEVTERRQQAAVQAWLNNPNNDAPPSHLFNAKGRAYPDVSILGHKYLIVDQGRIGAVDGTSASAPVFAGMIARLNQKRLAAGKAVLGFLNPLIYKILSENGADKNVGYAAGAFNDITKGNNKGTEAGYGPGQICQYGFSSTSGYDPVSGVGTVNFEGLSKYIESL